MKKINIESIVFENREKLSETKNYPNSGFFIAKIESDIPKSSDLVIVDKKVIKVIFVCPESCLGFIEEVAINKPIEFESIIQNDNKYDSDFILEFSRILLNRK